MISLRAKVKGTHSARTETLPQGWGGAEDLLSHVATPHSTTHRGARGAAHLPALFTQ